MAVQNWADDVESELPPRVETVEKDGTVTIVEYLVNEKGKKVKVTRKIKRTKVLNEVNQDVAARKNLAKFGASKRDPPGPVRATTTVGEAVTLKIQPGGFKEVTEDDEREAMKKKMMHKTITCRLCSGEHWTNKCPYKDTLGGITGEPEGLDNAESATPATNTTGKYVPPSMRAGANSGSKFGDSMHRRDDYPTLRVTNLSEDTSEGDLWDLFGKFGHLHRVFVGKDQETGLCKGFAFVSFVTRSDAETAMKKIDGLPYDHLILGCTWSVPKSEGGGRKD